MSHAMRFDFPLPPNILNARMHWRTKQTARKRYNAECDTMQGAGMFPPPPAVPMSPVAIASVLYVGGRMDDDNALARIKWPVDWLRTRGYIVDDGHPHCRMTVPTQIIQRKDLRAELTIEPLTGET